MTTVNTPQSRCSDRPGSPMIDIVNREAIGIGEERNCEKRKNEQSKNITKYIRERERERAA